MLVCKKSNQCKKELMTKYKISEWQKALNIGMKYLLLLKSQESLWANDISSLSWFK